MDTPNTNPNAGSQVGQSPAQQAGASQPAVKPIDEFVAKKKIKNIDDIPKLYEEQEASFHRANQKLQTLKQQVEQNSQGSMTVDDNGNLIQNPSFQPPQGTPGYGYQPQGGYQQNQPGSQQEQLYDPMLGTTINDPVLLQAARLPFGQRELFFANVALEVRENQQRQSYTIEQEVLNAPEAKGFENDVRSVMNQLPLQHRADKKQWQDALLRVKGIKFDEMRKNAGQEGVENFLSKQSIQSMPAQGGGQQGAQLNQEQEQAYQWYVSNQPGMFKDRQHFLSRYSNKR